MSKGILGGNSNRRWMIVALVLIVIVGIAITSVFAVRMFRRERQLLQPRETNVSLIAGWMTVDYIGRTFRVPPDELFRELEIPATRRDPRSLNELAAQLGRPPAEMITATRVAVEKLQIAFPRAKPGDSPDSQQPKPQPDAKSGSSP